MKDYLYICAFLLHIFYHIDVQEWETETLDIDFGRRRLSSDDDLGLDLAGGLDDPICQGEGPIYIASINKVRYC